MREIHMKSLSALVMIGWVYLLPHFAYGGA